MTLGHWVAFCTNASRLDETLGRHVKVAAFSSEDPGVEKPTFLRNFVPRVSGPSLLSVMTVCPLGHLRAAKAIPGHSPEVTQTSTKGVAQVWKRQQ